jgi:transcription elongation factor Elf1
MSLYIDRKYAQQIGSTLENFTVKGANLYNFRCPFCNDSKKSKTKSRGYFYNKNNDLFFRCHNCGSSKTIGTFIKEFDPTLYNEYILERWRNGENGRSNYKKPEENKIIPASKNWKEYFLGYQSIAALENGHYAKTYMESREIPAEHLANLYYAPDFKEFIDKILPGNTHDLPHNDPRVLIPIINRSKQLIAIQGRSLLNPTVRYITIKVRDEPKVFGMNTVDLGKKIYVVEGPFDSMFLENSIAILGSDVSDTDIPKNTVFVYDNEPRNLQIILRMEKVINQNHPIVIWPENVKHKDINDMYRAKVNFKELIESHTYQGMEARLKLAMWRKV